jgi:PEGA domain-containing protein
MRRFAFLLSGVLLAAIPAVAAAQPNAHRAEELAAEGLALYRQAAYEQAIAKFQESYGLVPEPNNLFNIGKCYERMGKFEQAIESYRRYIVEAENAADRQEVEQRIRNLEGRPASVSVTSNPPGATVFVDDTSSAPAGRTPVTLQLGPGPHILTLRMDGYEQSTRPVQGGFGREIGVDIALAPVAHQGDDGQRVIIRDDGTRQVVPAEEAKALHLGASVGVGLGSVGTEVTLTPSIAFGFRIGYGLQVASKIFVDIAASGYFEPRQAGTPLHSVTSLTFLLEPALRLQLSDDVFLSLGAGIGAMNLIGLEKGDEFFTDPEAEASGALLSFLDIRAAASVWIHLTEDIAATITLGLDYSPAITGILGDFVRFGGSAGVVYRF